METSLPEDIETDLCIVGSGFAGLTLAHQFANTKTRVVIVESGRKERDPAADELNEMESVGAPRVMDQERLRARVFGGTSQLWTGRCGPLDDIDLERRDWVNLSDWPVAMRDLEGYFDRAAKLMKLGPAFFDERAWRVLNHTGIERKPQASGMRNVFWQFSRPTTRGRYLHVGRDFETTANNVRVILGATVTRVDAANGQGQLAAVRVVSGSGDQRMIRAKAIVLAAGGIENPRLLLASRDGEGKSLGNQHDNVGRYLQDHPRCTLLTLEPKKSGRIQKEFGHYWVKKGSRLYDYQRGLGVAFDTQRRDKLLNSAAWLNVIPRGGSAKESVKRLLDRKSKNLGKDISAIVSGIPEVAGASFQRFAMRQSSVVKTDDVHFTGMCEQVPDRDSRVTLGNKHDRFGMALPRVDWRISAEERATMRRLSRGLAAEMAARGQKHYTLPEWVVSGRDQDAVFIDVAHPIGATRMSADPRTGVVDRECQIHDAPGIYIAGSSVFPTGGHVNPTMAIVALSLRLADRLKSAVFA